MGDWCYKLIHIGVIAPFLTGNRHTLQEMVIPTFSRKFHSVDCNFVRLRGEGWLKSTMSEGETLFCIALSSAIFPRTCVAGLKEADDQIFVVFDLRLFEMKQTSWRSYLSSYTVGGSEILLTSWGWYFIPLFTRGFIHPFRGAPNFWTIHISYKWSYNMSQPPKTAL